jgi:hypothetical protein
MAVPQLQTFEEGQRLAQALRDGEVPEHKKGEAEAALADLQQRLEQENKSPALLTAEQNSQRLGDVSTAVNMLASNPVGRKVEDPYQGALGSRITAPRPDEDWILANQARDAGIDIHSGAGISERFGQGLANLKDPQLRFQMLDSHYRKQLDQAGVPWPETVPTVMVEEQTGKLAYVRAITEDDLNQGEAPENVGRTRLTLVDAEGLDLGDIAEFAPILPTVVGQTAASLAAGALLKSPQAAIFASSAATAAIEGLSSPLKNRLLRDYYGVTEQELMQFSNPNEALEQALFAGGLDFAMGQGMVLARFLRNSRGKRVLTEDDYKALVDELDETRKLSADLNRATGESIEDPLMFIESASAKMDTATGQQIGVLSANFFKRLPSKWKGMWASANNVTRLKLARGFRTIANRSTDEVGDASRIGLDENGLAMPVDDITANAEQIVAATRAAEGVNAAEAGLVRATDDATRAMDSLHNNVSSAHYRDVQTIAANDIARASMNEELQWAYFKSFLEPNATNTAYGIQLVNGRNSPIRRALGAIDTEGLENLSKSMGESSQRFVQDMAALRGDQLDIMQMHRLRSDLLRTKRRIANGTDQSGWTRRELDSVIDALDDTIRTQDWVRTSTGRKVPGVKAEALPRLQMARESTEYMNNMARRSSIQDLTDTIQVYDGGTGRRFGTRRRFAMEPAQVRDTLFEAGNAGPLNDILEMSGSHPGLRAALADELEGIYKQMALNADGTFQRGGYNQFMAQYGDHAEALFGSQQAARITTADQMQVAVQRANQVADKVEDAYRAAFGDAVDPQKVGADGVVKTIMSSTGVTARQARGLMTRLRTLDPNLHQAVRAEFARWFNGQASKSPIQLKNGNALGNILEGNRDKIVSVMGKQFYDDMQLVRRMSDLVDYSDAIKGTAEPVQAAWLQVTRSVFGPLSRKQRFMTAANRIMRGRGAEKAIELMTDPAKLRQYVQLSKLSPKTVAFWSTVDALGLRALFEENGVVPPDDLDDIRIREAAFRNLAQGGPL